MCFEAIVRKGIHTNTPLSPKFIITTETKNTPLSPKFIIILDALHGYKSEMFSKGVMLILYIYPFIFVTFPVELHHVYCKYKVMP